MWRNGCNADACGSRQPDPEQAASAAETSGVCEHRAVPHKIRIVRAEFSLAKPADVANAVANHFPDTRETHVSALTSRDYNRRSTL